MVFDSITFSNEVRSNTVCWPWTLIYLCATVYTQTGRLIGDASSTRERERARARTHARVCVCSRYLHVRYRTAICCHDHDQLEHPFVSNSFTNRYVTPDDPIGRLRETGKNGAFHGWDWCPICCRWRAKCIRWIIVRWRENVAHNITEKKARRVSVSWCVDGSRTSASVVRGRTRCNGRRRGYGRALLVSRYTSYPLDVAARIGCACTHDTGSWLSFDVVYRQRCGALTSRPGTQPQSHRTRTRWKLYMYVYIYIYIDAVRLTKKKLFYICTNSFGLFLFLLLRERVCRRYSRMLDQCPSNVGPASSAGYDSAVFVLDTPLPVPSPMPAHRHHITTTTTTTTL